MFWKRVDSADDGKREAFQMAMQTKGLKDWTDSQENAAVKEPLADVTYRNLTVLTARS
jgi:hypothetical protein